MEEKLQILGEYVLTTTVGAPLFSTEIMVAQFDFVPMGTLVETLIIEVDQEKYKE